MLPNELEKNLDTTSRDFVAVFWAIMLLGLCLEFTNFTGKPDHHVLKWILNQADAAGKLERWRLQLLKQSFEAVHHAVVKNQAADALLRQLM